MKIEGGTNNTPLQLQESGMRTHHNRRNGKYLGRTADRLIFLVMRTHVPGERSQHGNSRREIKALLDVSKHPWVGGQLSDRKKKVKSVTMFGPQAVRFRQQ